MCSQRSHSITRNRCFGALELQKIVTRNLTRNFKNVRFNFDSNIEHASHPSHMHIAHIETIEAIETLLLSKKLLLTQLKS